MFALFDSTLPGDNVKEPRGDCLRRAFLIEMRKVFENYDFKKSLAETDEKY
jgi:hypothetical protein